MTDCYESLADNFRKLDMQHVKTVALLLICVCTVYHGAIHAYYGRDSCGWLLSSGHYQGNQVWQPYGCMLHVYSKVDAKQCLKRGVIDNSHSWVVFVGDSRIRQLFTSLVSHIDNKYEEENIELLIYGKNNSSAMHPAKETRRSALTKPHADLLYDNKDLRTTLEFKWVPVLNDSFTEICKHLKKDRNNVPDLVIAGSGTWSIKSSNGSLQALEEYKSNLTHATEVLDSLALYGTKVLWMLQDPVSPSLLAPNRMMITNEQIDLYNYAALKAFYRSRVRVWASSRLILQGSESWFDGLHIGNGPLRNDLQVLLNFHCNDYMRFKDGTCCSSAESLKPMQLFSLSLFLVCFLLCGAKAACAWSRPRSLGNSLEQPDLIAKERQHGILVKTTGVLAAISRLGVIVAYLILCDRTTYFMKENKYFSALNFWLPIGYVLALGFFFSDQSKDTKFLHRDQTDEWKGWMQLVILVYHMTGASSVVPIYVNMRTLVSSYLFLTGYGHFYYVWQTGDMGFVRFMQVLFRMNFFVAVLCLCMNRPYQHYYYAPLVSFWFVVIYILLALPPRVTAANSIGKPFKYLYVVLKFVALVAGINVLFMSVVFFEHIFTMPFWRWLFVTTDGSIQEWWFRWSLDRYSVVFGMVFALTTIVLDRHALLENYLSQRRLEIIGGCIGIFGLVSQLIFSFLCPSKEQCNEIHSYSAFVPVISFILLRNSFGMLRRYYSRFYAWFGSISLELYAAQYHIWLAADKNGVLVLIPGYPVANVVLTTFIFVCISHEVHDITRIITRFFVPDDTKLIFRNLLILCVVAGSIYLYGFNVSQFISFNKLDLPPKSHATQVIS